MDELIQLSNREKSQVFDEASKKLGYSSIVIEKDFWVCWLLKLLFEEAEFQEYLIF